MPVSDSSISVFTHVVVLLLAFAQNIAFSIVSRSRNRDNMTYHVVAAIFSNAVWFLTFKSLITANMALELFPTYTAGTVSGSVLGVRISMWIERLLGASSDAHLKKEPVPAKVGLVEKDSPQTHAAVDLRIKQWRLASTEVTPLPTFLGLSPAQYDAFITKRELPLGYSAP